MADFNITAVLGADVSEFRSGLQKAKKAMEGLSTESGGLKEVNSSLQGLKKNAGGLTQLASGVGKLSAAIGITKAISIGISAINNSIGDAVSRVDTLNRFPKVLESMGVSTDEAEESIKRLSDGIQGLPTALDDIAGSAQRMYTILGDMELATESTLALNNAFLASGASTADASRGLAQYTQMLSAGKVDMQSWRTLQETMPYALKETAEAFGFVGESATNDFYSALLDGDVTMSDFNDKLIELSNETGGFAETALTASEGIATSWQNLKTAIVGGVAGIIDSYNQWAEDNNFLSIAGVIESMKEKIRSAFNVVTENVPVILEWFRMLFETIQNSTAFQTLTDVVSQFLEKGQEVITLFLQSEEWALFKEKITQIKDAILEIDFQQLLTDLQVFIDKWSPLIAGVMGAIVAFKLITGTFTLFTKTITLAKNAVTLGGAAISFLTSPIGIAVVAIGAIIAIGVLLYKNWDTIKEKAKLLGDKMRTAFEDMKRAIKEKVDSIKTSISDGFKGAYDTVVGWLTDFKNAGANIVGNIAAGISGAIRKVKDAVSGVLQAARDLLPFSPPKDKTSPLVDIHKNGITGQIAKGITGGESDIQKAMRSVLEGLNTDVNMSANMSATLGSAMEHQHKFSDFGQISVNQQPAYINLTMGGHTYRTFVEDISEQQGRAMQLELSFLS